MEKLDQASPKRTELPYHWGFGVDAHDPQRYDLSEPRRFLSLLRELGIYLVNISGRQSLLQSTHSASGFVPSV